MTRPALSPPPPPRRSASRSPHSPHNSQRRCVNQSLSFWHVPELLFSSLAFDPVATPLHQLGRGMRRAVLRRVGSEAATCSIRMFISHASVCDNDGGACAGCPTDFVYRQTRGHASEQQRQPGGVGFRSGGIDGRRGGAIVHRRSSLSRGRNTKHDLVGLLLHARSEPGSALADGACGVATQATAAGGEGARDWANDAWKRRGSSVGYGSDDSEVLGSEDLSSSQHSGGTGPVGGRDGRRHLISTWLPNGENVESALAAVAALNQNSSPHGLSGASAHRIARELFLLVDQGRWEVSLCLTRYARPATREVELASTRARALYALLNRAATIHPDYHGDGARVAHGTCISWLMHAKGGGVRDAVVEGSLLGAQSAAGATPPAAASSSAAAAQPPRRHLALPVEQRANLRRLMDTLQRRASKTKTDLEVGAVCALVRSVVFVGCPLALVFQSVSCEAQTGPRTVGV